MSHMMDHYELFLPVNLINHAINSYTDSVSVFDAVKFSASQGKGVIAKRFNCLENLGYELPVDGSQISFSRALPFDFIRGHLLLAAFSIPRRESSVRAYVPQ